ncbi:MAG: hypothetical protein ACOVQM_20585 [Pirellula sp.]
MVAKAHRPQVHILLESDTAVLFAVHGSWSPQVWVKGGVVLSVGFLKTSILGEYFALSLVVHATVCACIWAVHSLQNPMAIGLVIGCGWTAVRAAELVPANIGSLILSFALAGGSVGMCFAPLDGLPSVGLLMAVQPPVCACMLSLVFFLDFWEWRSKHESNE